MPIEALFPVAGNHAVQQAAFVIEWPTPLADSVLMNIAAVHQQLEGSFPVIQKPQTVSITFGPEAASAGPTTNVDGMGGVHFLKPDPHGGPMGIERAIQVSKQNLVVLINKYTRWDSVWPEVSGWLNLLTPFILDGQPITGATLQYSDKLLWRGDPSKLPLNEILREGSKYLPANAFETKGLWHSHHGFIAELDTPIDYQRVDNVNVNLVPEPPSLAIQLVTSHRGTLKNPIWDTNKAGETIASLMQSFHQRNKQIIKDLLTDQVCEKIGLA